MKHLGCTIDEWMQAWKLEIEWLDGAFESFPDIAKLNSSGYFGQASKKRAVNIYSEWERRI
jgi:hypothetical protein